MKFIKTPTFWAVALVIVLVASAFMLSDSGDAKASSPPQTSKSASINPEQLKWLRDQHVAQLAYTERRLVIWLDNYPDMQLSMMPLDDPRREELQARVHIVEWHKRKIEEIDRLLEKAGAGSVNNPATPFPAGSPLNKLQGGQNEP